MDYEQENEFLREKFKTIVRKLKDYEQTVDAFGADTLGNVRQMIESEIGITYEELLTAKVNGKRGSNEGCNNRV